MLMNKGKNTLLKGRIDTKDAQFGMINQATLHELSLRIPERNVNARMVYILLLTFADEKGVCWPSQDLLAKILNVQRTTIVQAFKTLREFGFIMTKEVKGTRALKVQTYTVPHKLIFKEDTGIFEEEDLIFPDLDQYLSNAVDVKNSEIRRDICSSEQTVTCVPEKTDNCLPQNNNSLSDATQTDQGTYHVNRPSEHTTPLIYTPPSSVEDLKDDKPHFLSSSEISDIYEHGIPSSLQDIVNDSLRGLLPEVQSLFLYIQQWNSFWGFEGSSLTFSEADVIKAIDLLKYFSYDELMNKIHDIAEWMDSPSKIVDFNQFRIILRNGF